MAFKDSQQNLQKKYQNMKLSTIFGKFGGINGLSNTNFEATFNCNFFITFNFFLS